MSSVRLNEPASDWTGHTLETRLRLSAHALFTHGELSPEEWRRITGRIGNRAVGERCVELARVSFLPVELPPASFVVLRRPPFARSAAAVWIGLFALSGAFWASILWWIFG